MAAVLRAQVLKEYKNCFKACNLVFKGDQFALKQMHQKTRDEFRQFQNLTEEKQIQEKIKFASEAAEGMESFLFQPISVAEALSTPH